MPEQSQPKHFPINYFANTGSWAPRVKILSPQGLREGSREPAGSTIDFSLQPG